jgi:hypothetical protein
MTRSLAIVGAGTAGVGAAEALRGTDVAVTILEKSRGVGGRAATRRKHGCTYDHGANYVKDADERTAALIRDLGTEGLVDVSLPVWTFDADGTVSEGEDRDARKWTWEAGITQFAKRVLARGDATVETETRVAAVDAVGEQWSLTDADGRTHGPFDGVLLTPPAPQTAGLLAETNWDDAALPALREAVGAVTYRTIRTLVLHYPFEAEFPWYALVDTSKEHAVGWVGREECKPGHVPDGESLWVVQMGPDWSAAHYDDPVAEAAAAAADRVADLVGEARLADPDWVDDQGWRYALPDAGAATAVLERGEDAGLFFAGDWVAGEGRVYAAYWNGVEAGERVAETL